MYTFLFKLNRVQIIYQVTLVVLEGKVPPFNLQNSRPQTFELQTYYVECVGENP